MSDKAEEDIRNLAHILDTLKKGANRNFKQDTLKAKLNLATEIYTEIESVLVEEEDKFSTPQQTYLVKLARNTFTEIKNIITNKLRVEKPIILMKNTLFTTVRVFRFVNKLKIKLKK